MSRPALSAPRAPTLQQQQRPAEMDRPASRGSASALGAHRPSTGSSRQGPPSTGAAPGGLLLQRGAAAAAAPPDTAYKRVAGGRAAVDAALAAPARPLTQQGIAAAGAGRPAATATAGGRQVLDRAYFVGELRQKRQQIIAVNAQMRDELEVLEQKKTAASRAEKVAAQLRKEVRLLQEALADNNIVIDKAGSHAPIAAIHDELSEIAARNEAQQARAEGILSARLALEQRAKQAEAQILEIQAAMDRRLASMPPSARQQYGELLAEQAALLAEVANFEEGLGELGAAVAAAEGELGRSPFKQRALQLQEQIKLLTERRYELAAAEEAAQAPPEEQREVLLARVKRDNAVAEAQAAEAKALQEEVRRLEAATPAAEARGAAVAAAAPAQDDAGRREKFEELVTKERELQAFLDAFPQRRGAKQEELAARQEAVLAALERMAKLQAIAGSALPSTAEFQHLQDELEYKQQQVASAAATSEVLRAELAARRGELQRIDGLEDKIAAELASLRERVGALRTEVATFGGADEARAAKEAARSELEGRRAQLVAQRDAVKAALADQLWQQQAKEAQLREYPAWPAIDRLDQQQRQLQAQIDAVSEAAAGQQAGADYRPLLPQLGELVAGVNAATVAALSSAG